MRGIKYFIILLVGNLLHFNAFSHKALEHRYEEILQLLRKYERPFTFMEVGAKNGELSFAVARQFNNAVCIMSELNSADQLLENCKNKNKLNNIILLKHHFSVDDFNRFGECEHIDVIFFSNSLFTEYNWKAAIDGALTFGDFIIIEAPDMKLPLYETVRKYFKEKGGELLYKSTDELHKESNPLYLFTINKKYLSRRSWNYGKKRPQGEYTIQSNFTQKKFIKEKKNPKGYFVTDWNAGMNLNTFKTLHGTYPLKESIRKMLEPLSTIKHNDLHIFNIIIQGEKLIPIDCNEDGRKHTVNTQLPLIINQFRFKDLTLLQEFELDDKYLIIIENAFYDF